MKSRLLVYGAYGYTGELIAEHATALGLKPILAGRDEAKLKPVAEKLNMEHRAFGLGDANTIKAALADVAVVIHCAGPFQFTYKAMSDACLATGTHYLDITGEFEVFEALAAQSDAAAKAGIILMPGTGFDVVPSDCLANYLKQQLPDANELTLAFYSSGRPSRGTAKTIIESMGKGGMIRKDGKLKVVPAGYRLMQIDFGDGQPRWAATIPWGDISTAWQSTRIPNIQVFMAMHGSQAKKMKQLNRFGWLFNMRFVKNFLKKQVDKQKPGPSTEAREKGFTLLWGEVKNAQGKTAEAFLRVPDGYQLTFLASVAIAQRILAGDYRPGFQTPAGLYGADFIKTFPGVTLRDK